MQTEKNKFKIVRLLMLFGAVLLLINIFGLFKPLRNPDIYQEEKTYFKNDIILTEEEFYKKISRENELDKDYVKKVVRAVNDGFAHYTEINGLKSEINGLKKYNLLIPFYENYILYALKFILPLEYYKYYEYCDYHKAIARGVGQCGQASVILSGILEDNNIKAKIAWLNGLHVVNLVQVDKENDLWWVADPDYGVIIENDLEEIEKNPEIIIPYYQEKIPEIKDKNQQNKIINILLTSYKGKNKVIANGINKYCGPKYYIEYLSYILIWVLPIILILPYLYLKIKSNYKQ
jgi:hypothetical protein